MPPQCPLDSHRKGVKNQSLPSLSVADTAHHSHTGETHAHTRSQQSHTRSQSFHKQSRHEKKVSQQAEAEHTHLVEELKNSVEVEMTKISTGLRSFICLLPADAPDHGDGDGDGDAGEQPGTSYTSSEAHSFTSYTESNRRGARGREKVNCSIGGAQMLACFRAGAINLIVHPAMAMGGQRQGASTVQPVTSLPRAAFLDGAEDHDSGDDPTSPVVTCIGQVRKDKASKTPPRNNAEVADLGSLKAKRGKPQANAVESTSTPSSPRPSKWKKILGARGTVNPSQQTRSEESESGEFHIDLNRFGSACSSGTDQASTPSFGNMNGVRAFPAGKFLAKPLTTLQTMHDDARNVGDGGVCEDGSVLGSVPVQSLDSKPRASEEVLLWKRRSGARQPLTLEVKRRVLKSDFR